MISINIKINGKKISKEIPDNILLSEFLRDNLSPENNICDKSIILHEMIHHYQKSVDRSFDLDEKTLWTLQERQALYYQNLFVEEGNTKQEIPL